MPLHAPGDPQIHLNLGLVKHQQGRGAESIASYHEALRLRSDHAETHFNLGAALLSGGDFAAGWPQYDWRLRCKKFVWPNFDQPLWDGSPLDDQVLLLHAEQGFGDTLQFIRYLPQVQARAKNVVVEVQAPLLPLLTQSGFAGLVPRGEPRPRFDAHAPLLSLPGNFATTLETVPAAVPYLAVNADRVERWRDRLHEWPGLRIGITWQGNPGFECDRLRSIPLAEFAPLAEVPGVRLLSLQKYDGLDQLAAVGGRFEVVDLGSRLDLDGAFLDTAAVMLNLDLVITSDTVAAHLAGALAAPVWLGVSASPEWRWLRDREDSPWYPSMRLFRQRQHGDWTDVFRRMAVELRRLAAAGQSG